MKTFIALMLVVVPFSLSATIRSATPDCTVAGFSHQFRGANYSDGKRLFCGDTGALYIFNNIPTTDTNITSASVRITGFRTTYPVQTPSPCVVGNKLLVGDSDPVLGYVIRVWNNVPTANTTIASCDYKITGFSGSYSITTDGTKVAFAEYGPIYVWNNFPTTDSTKNSSTSFTTGGYNEDPVWFGASGRFYTINAYAGPRHKASVFDPMPAGEFVKDGGTDIYVDAPGPAWAGYYTKMSVIEIRNIIYIFLYDEADTKEHVYIWRDIPTADTNKSTMSDSFLFTSGYAPYDFVTADLRYFYLWTGPMLYNLYKIRNDYDTFSVTGTDLAPSSIDRNHKNQVYYKVKIYTYPGKTVLNSVKLTLTGTCADADVSAVRIYEDVNNDGVYTPGSDSLLGSGTFSGKSVQLDNINLWTDAGEKNILIVYDISSTATIGNSVGVSVEYFIFEGRFYEYPAGMSSGVSSISATAGPVWSGKAILDYTQRQADSDSVYTISISYDPATSSVATITYVINHYIDGALSEQITETSATTKVIANLDISGKHKFTVKIVDSFGNETAESEFLYDDTSPEWDGKFRIEDSSKVNADGKWDYRIKINWDAGSDNTSKEILYEVFVKEEGKDWEIKTATWDKTIEVSGLSGVIVLKMRARDSAGNYCGYGSEKKIRLNPFLLFDAEAEIGREGGTITLTELEGDRVELEIPEGALSKKLRINVEKIHDSEYTYKFGIYDGNNTERNVVFAKPVTIKYYYNDAKLIRLGFKEEYLHVLHHENGKWRNIGGEINENENTVRVQTRSFSKYKLSGIKDNSGKGIVAYPETLTPNNDEINDFLFLVANWNYSGNMSVEIYDLNGRKIWGYAGSDKSVAWDCRDASGNLAEAGIYLCVIRIENKIITKSVLIAR